MDARHFDLPVVPLELGPVGLVGHGQGHFQLHELVIPVLVLIQVLHQVHTGQFFHAVKHEAVSPDVEGMDDEKQYGDGVAQG